MEEVPTASIIIIGNEILSGRTLDTNTQVIALSLGNIGISLIETRTIPDNKNMIINTVNELRGKYSYVFTTGGIGPTHDDITSESIAAAFGVNLVRDEKIFQIIIDYYAALGEEVNSAREKMAFVPEGAELIYNTATKIPSFAIGNVFSLAGIPEIMKAMLDSCFSLLKRGKIIKNKSLTVMVGESKIAASFEALQRKYPDVGMGSYPFTKEDKYGTTLVLRSKNYDNLEKSYSELEEMIIRVIK